jgi:hypothetical protein
MPGDGQFIAGKHPLRAHPDAVHLRAVAASQVADHPVAVEKLQFAMAARHVGKSQGDVATVTPADQ